MTAPFLSPAPDPTEEVWAKARQLRSAGVPIQEIDAYVQSKLGAAHSAPHSPTIPGFAAESSSVTPRADTEGQPGVGSKVLGTIASLVRDVPGGEAAQAGVRALVRRQPYAEARADIREAEDAAPAIARIPARIVGGALSAAALPGGAALQGARYGVLSGLGQSDPKADIKERLKDATVGAATGALAGKAADLGGTLLRAKVPVSLGGVKTLGRNELDRQAAMEAADQLGYGAATAEGAAAGGTSPEIQAALSHPTVEPFVKSVRSLEQYKNASDADVLQEAYKQMSEYQRRLGRVIENAPDFRPTPAAETQHVALGKERMLNAADQTMPSLRPAVQAHAQAEGQLDAFGTGADAAKRIISGAQPASRYFAARSPEAFSEFIAPLTGADATAAREGVLGTLKNQSGPDRHITHLFGAGSSLLNAAKVQPYVTALDRASGNSTGDILRALGISALTPSP